MNIRRIEDTLNQINAFSQTDEELTRLAYTHSERQAVNCLATLFEAEGLTVKIDEIGNVIGRREGNDPTLPVVACGSHIDTVYNAGQFDGTVGVAVGLEVIRYLNEQRIQTAHPIEIIVFACEESARFGVSTIGSKAMAGLLDRRIVENLEDKDGVTFAQALAESDLDIDTIERAKREKTELKVFYELHIEQGPILEKMNKQIGIVTGIAAPTRFHIRIEGWAAHSGSTPMNLRKDAFSAAAEIARQLEIVAHRETSKGTVATIGDCIISPGAMNVVPGRVDLKIDIRGTSEKSKAKVIEALYSTGEMLRKKRGFVIEITKLIEERPVLMNESIIKSIETTCRERNISYEKMSSGAGHDAMNMAKLCPTGLIFVPSKDGVSHNPKEYTLMEDIELGAIVLKDEILKTAIEL